MGLVYCGIDWADDHHDVQLVDERGDALARRRVAASPAGFSDLLGLLAEHGGTPETTRIGIETEHGLLVAALRAAGYRIYPINPKAVDRYRDRHHLGKGKSDRVDAGVLAHILRTDEPMHRPLPVDSEQARALVVVARAHKDLIWNRQREVNQLTSLLKQYFPAALVAFEDLTTNTALGLLAAAPTPTQAAGMSPDDLLTLLVAAGRGRRHGEARRLARIFAMPALEQPPAVAAAMGAAAAAHVHGIAALSTSIKELERTIAESFNQHPDAEIYLSFPGLGVILSARVLGELGDDPARWPHPADLRAYAGTAPITRQSGKTEVVLHRWIRNKRLYDAVRQWAFTAIKYAPGARALYQHRIAAGDSHEAALRRVGGKLLGQLHHCLTHRERYSETKAWVTGHPQRAAA